MSATGAANNALPLSLEAYTNLTSSFTGAQASSTARARICFVSVRGNTIYASACSSSMNCCRFAPVTA
eukprot:1868974-Amphidinium_carterae.4